MGKGGVIVMAIAKREPQRAFDEEEVQDSALEALLGDYFDAREAASEPGKWFRQAKKALKGYVGERPNLLDRLLDGGLLRVGPFVLAGKALEGGPTEIPEWKSWTATVLRTGTEDPVRTFAEKYHPRVVEGAPSPTIEVTMPEKG
jgi:hypothetical protein